MAASPSFRGKLNIERTQIHFSATFSLPSSSKDLKVPNVSQGTGQFDSDHLSSRVSFIHFADVSLFVIGL